jgi:hypothetical protein
VAYATQEILIVLTLAGTAFLYLAPWLAIAVVLLLATVVSPTAGGRGLPLRRGATTRCRDARTTGSSPG